MAQEESPAEDRRNLIDEFKGLSVEEIRSRLALRRRSFASLILNIDYDLNISTIVRNHNAFCGQEIFYLGRRRFNRRGCVGTYLYENITHFGTLEEALEGIPKDYTWVGVEQKPSSIPLPEYRWPAKPLIVLGHERSGLDLVPEILYRCRDLVSIPQAGSVRSLNVGVAAGIVLYDFLVKGNYLESTLPKRT